MHWEWFTKGEEYVLQRVSQYGLWKPSFRICPWPKDSSVCAPDRYIRVIPCRQESWMKIWRVSFLWSLPIPKPTQPTSAIVYARDYIHMYFHFYLPILVLYKTIINYPLVAWFCSTSSAGGYHHSSIPNGLVYKCTQQKFFKSIWIDLVLILILIYYLYIYIC